MPEISVIVPVYNSEKYLKKCLDSIIAQTFKDIEIICVNDGSPDNSADILEEYASKDSRIKIITQKNQGLSGARNAGMEIASGKYIYFCDADDFIHHQCLEIAHHFASKYNADLVSFKFVENDDIELRNLTLDPENIEHKISENPVLEGSYRQKFKINFNVWSKLYKKELLNGINFIPRLYSEDYPYTFAVLSKKPKTVILSQALYFYTINTGSIIRQKATPQQIKDYHKGISYIYDIYNKPELKKELDFLKVDMLPNLLKQQFNRCRRADKSVRPDMFAAFKAELLDLKSKNFLSWRGHKLSRYIKYLWLMRRR